MTKGLDVRYRSDFLLDGKGDARSPLGAAAGLNKQEAALVDRIQERVARNLRAWKDGDIRPFARQNAQDLEAAFLARGGLWVVLNDLQLTAFREDLDFLLDGTDSGSECVGRAPGCVAVPVAPTTARRAGCRDPRLLASGRRTTARRPGGDAFAERALSPHCVAEVLSSGTPRRRPVGPDVSKNAGVTLHPGARHCQPPLLLENIEILKQLQPDLSATWRVDAVLGSGRPLRKL